jgi:adenylate cyclase
MSDAARRFGELLLEMGLVTPLQIQEALALQELTGSRIGEALISLGHLTRSQLQRALSQALVKSQGPKVDKPPLGEILVGLNYVQPHQVEAALTRQLADGRKLGELLIELNIVNHVQVNEALGLQHRMASSLEQERPQLPRAKELAQAVVSGRRVVVIDDSPLACNLVDEGLTMLGYEVFTFTAPLAALEQLEALKPAIVLTDLDMPGLDGEEVCRRVKRGGARGVPVVILTANDAEAQRVQGLRAGADDYVHKGASMEELSARIESILRRTGETDRMRRLFARYTSDAVVDELLRVGEVVLTGEKREVTVLFADVRNFTSIAETHPPEQVVSMLSGILGSLADVVLSWGGTLDKFLGDGVMAVFGAPVRHGDDAARALQCAMGMLEQAALRNLHRGDDPALELGIGINTGLVIAGTLGNARRSEYTCIGDVVNVASRLCAVAGVGEILVGEATARAVDVERFEQLPPVRLKGKLQPVPLFKVTPALAEHFRSGDRF